MSAMTYPAIMMVVGGAIVLFLLAYVVPQVTRVFAEAKQMMIALGAGIGRFDEAAKQAALVLLATKRTRQLMAGARPLLAGLSYLAAAPRRIGEDTPVAARNGDGNGRSS